MSLKVTVITVVYNASSRIADTVESILAQDHDNIEYIIKDGGSTDGTLEVIRDYAGRYDMIRYISAPDDGIYDAMNVALDLATGDVIEFLNAGDRFAADDTVSRAMKVMESCDADVVYGDVVYENPDGSRDVRTYPQSSSRRIYYLTGDCINHQCMFVKKSLFDGNKFDTSFRICADREWMLRVGMYTPDRRMTALGFPVAIYPLDGYSLINKEQYRAEASRCIRKYIPWGYPLYALFEFFRAHAFLSKLLHGLYKRLYISDDK